MRRTKLHAAHSAALILAVGLAALSAIAYAQTAGDSYITFHGDLARTGWNAGETQLTPSAIDNRMSGQGRFGKLWEYRFMHGDPGIPEQVYATPLYYKGMVFAATQRNWVYALDADEGTLIWERWLGLDPPLRDPIHDNICGMDPWRGITSTPVLDPTTETLYIIDLRAEGTNFIYKMYALDILTGEVRPGWPVVLDGAYRGTAFNVAKQMHRGGLTLLDGWVYATFSSRCDSSPWHGWIIGVNTANPRLPMRVYSTTLDGNGGGIWGPGGISVDDDGHMYVVTGNGTFNGDRGGRSFSQSLLQLNPEDFDPGPENFYTPPNVVQSNNRDEDLGGSSALVIPDQSDTPTDTPHMALFAGKDGVAYLVNRDDLGRFVSPNGAQIQRLKVYKQCLPCGAKVAPAYFDAGDKGRFIYLTGGQIPSETFIGNYLHLGDGNFGLGAGTRADLNTGPAAVVFNDRLFVAWVSDDETGNVFIKSSPDGRNWSETAMPVGVTVASHTSPALAVFNNRMAVAWIDSETQAVKVKFSPDGRSWPSEDFNVEAPAAADSSPSLTVFNNRLYVSWVADTPDRALMLKASANGTDWSAAIPINESSNHEGAVAALGPLDGRLYVFWATGNPGFIFYKSSPDGIDWTERRRGAGNSVKPGSSIALALYDDLQGQPRLHCFWQGNQSGNPPIYNRSLGHDLVTGAFELEPIATDTNERGFSGTSVAAAAFQGNLHLFFVQASLNREVFSKIAQPAFPGRGVVALQLTVEEGKSKVVPVWATPYILAYQVGSPYVTSNGPGDPILWIADPTSPATLRGLNALTGEELYNSNRRPEDRPSWRGQKFYAPVAIDGKVFLGTEGLTAYGLRPE